jgi:hypothetical protein
MVITGIYVLFMIGVGVGFRKVNDGFGLKIEFIAFGECRARTRVYVRR